MCSEINVPVSSMKSFFSFAKNNQNMMCIFGGLQMTCQHFIMKYRESIFGNSTEDRVPQKPALYYG